MKNKRKNKTFRNMSWVEENDNMFSSHITFLFIYVPFMRLDLHKGFYLSIISAKTYKVVFETNFQLYHESELLLNRQISKVVVSSTKNSSCHRNQLFITRLFRFHWTWDLRKFFLILQKYGNFIRYVLYQHVFLYK